MITLRDYQTEAVEFLLPRRRAFVKAPAGSGKTIIGASAIAKVVQPGWRVLWVANTREQVEQAIKAIESTPGPDGVEFQICCAAAAPDGRKFDLIVMDESHHTPAATWFAILQQAPGIVWGLSATPWSEDRERNDVMRDVFREFFEVERARVEASGSLAKGTVIFHDLDEPGCYDAEINLLTAEEVERRVRRFRFISRDEHERRAKWQITQTFVQQNPTRNAKIREIANAESAAGASVLLLIQSIEHGERLAEGIPGSALVFSRIGTKKRRELISAFRAGDLKVLAATSLADEGLDVPIASRLIMAAGGRAAGKIEQRAGRVLRPHPSKKDGGIIHDFLDRGAQYAMAQAKARRRVYEKLGYC